MLKQFFAAHGGRVRLLVGLMVAGFICIQCIPSPGNATVRSIAKEARADNLGTTAKQIEKLADSDHIKLLELCLENYRVGYTTLRCTFVKQERIRGRVSKVQEIDVKFRSEPFSVAMKWVKNPPAGDRVIFVDGWYKVSGASQMVVRPHNELLRTLAGGSVLRPPDGADAKRNTLRPVSMFGFEKAMEKLLEVYRRADENGDLQQEFGGYFEVGGRKTIKLTRRLPAKADYPTHITNTYIDLEYLAPIMIEGFGWNWSEEKKAYDFICRYQYKDIRFNEELTDEDFRPSNNDIKGRS